MANSLVQIRVDEQCIQCDDKAVSAMQRMSKAAEENGTADMTLEEINKEIQAVRQGR